MTSVKEILAAKPCRPVHTVMASTPVIEALREMDLRNIGALVVTDGERVVGIVTERDYTRKLALSSRNASETAVGDIMSAPVIHVSTASTSDDCIRLMAEHHMRHLPVIDQGRLLGIVSIRDLASEIIANI